MNNLGLCRAMWASTGDSFSARQFISARWHPISQTIKMINQALTEYPGTHFNWWGKQLMASCLFEVITLGLFPSASWEEVASLVQMLFVRSQDGEAGEASTQHSRLEQTRNRTMALPSLYPISQGTMLSLWHFSTHMKDKPCSYSYTLYAVLWYFGSVLLWSVLRERQTSAWHQMLKDLRRGHNHLVPACVSALPRTVCVCD